MDEDKALVWLVETPQTPPLSEEARLDVGYHLRRLQQGERLAMPLSRPMPSIGSRCHELRIDDKERKVTLRLIYRIDPDAIVAVHWFEKKTQKTPKNVIDLCQRRLTEYDNI